MYTAIVFIGLFALIGIGVYGAITATQMEKTWDKDEKNRLANLQKKLKIAVAICLAVTVVAGVMGISDAISSSSSSGSSSSRSAATCGYCGKTYYAGDSGGNYMSIARTNLCKRCYSTYKQGTDMLGH